jgi:hypothetical protein
MHDDSFRRSFSGDSSVAQEPMRPFAWASGHALSIDGTEYTQQCPFGAGNGYGDGRVISIFDGLCPGQRWEMQLQGGDRETANSNGRSRLAEFAPGLRQEDPAE